MNFVDNMPKMGYTEDEINTLLRGVKNDEPRSIGMSERGHSRTRYDRLHQFFGTGRLGTSRVEKTSKGTTRGNRRGISSDLQISNNKAGLNDNSAFSNGEQNSKFSIDDETKQSAKDNQYLSAVEKGEVLYASKNKKITNTLLRRAGFSMPTNPQFLGYIGIITYKGPYVNKR